MKRFTALLAIIMLAVLIITSCNTKKTSGSSSDALESDNNSSVPSATVSEPEESGKQVDTNDWIGKYTYGIQVFNDKGDFEFGIGYGITIYKENGKYRGRVEAGGKQMNQDFTVEFEEIDNRLDAYFVEQSSETIPPLPYEKNTKMFSLIKRDNIIYTIYHAYQIEGKEYKTGEETITFSKEKSVS